MAFSTKNLGNWNLWALLNGSSRVSGVFWASGCFTRDLGRHRSMEVLVAHGPHLGHRHEVLQQAQEGGSRHPAACCAVPGLVAQLCTAEVTLAFPSPKLDEKLRSTQDLRFLAPKTIPSMVFGTRILKYSVLGPPGSVLLGDGKEAERTMPHLDAFNVPLLRALWIPLDGIWGVLKGSWGVLVDIL